MNNSIDPTPTNWTSPAMQKRIASRYAAEKRFKFMGLMAIILSTAFLIFLLTTMIGNGFSGFQQTHVDLEVDFPTLTGDASAQSISGDGANAAIRSLDIPGIVETAIGNQYGAFAKEMNQSIFSSGAARHVSNHLKDDPN